MLRPRDFYRERNQLCYDAAIALSHRNQAIDQITLASELERTEKLDLVGGMAYLSHLVANTPDVRPLRGLRRDRLPHRHYAKAHLGRRQNNRARL